MVNMTKVLKEFNQQTGHTYELKTFFEDSVRRKTAQIILNRNELTVSVREISRTLTVKDLANMFPESIKVQKGGFRFQGTLMHRDLAIEYFRWLDPAFAV